MRWAYPPCPTTKRNSGYICYYCQRVWSARFKGNYASQQLFVKACGQDMELFQIFNHWLNMAVELMKEHQSNDITVKWGVGSQRAPAYH